MKKNQFKAFLFALLFFVGIGMYAQSISGTVSSADGPLPGATIVVKGTTNGTTTDFDGNFSINADQDAVLIISYVGFAAQEVSVSGQDQVLVTLQFDNELGEIIVTSYGNINKRDATGAVDALSSDSFDLVSADSPAQLLQGKVAGVQITSSTGEPGAGVSIRVRGNSSIRSGNEPLIVVDGIPLSGGNTSSGLGDQILGSGSSRNPLNFINQNDIESISILKDASSTAIYGSRGSNGVIVITTKRVKAGQTEPQITYSGSVGFSSFAQNSSYSDVMSRADFVANLPAADISVGAESGSYNWQDAILRSAVTTNHDVTISKASENSATRLSIGANVQDGIVKKTGLNKYNLTFFNSNDLFNNKLNLQTRVLYSNIKDKSHLLTNTAGYIGNLIGTALYWRPTLNTLDPTKTTNGGYTTVSNDYLNPLHLLDAYNDSTITNRILASITATVKISDKLDYKMIYAIDNSSSKRQAQLDPSIEIQGTAISGDNRGQGSIYNDERLNLTFENTLNYVNSFGALNVDALAGYSYYSYTSEGNQFHAIGFNANQTNILDNLDGVINSAPGYGVGSYKNQVELQSFFARVGLSYDKFVATLTYRIDGSSRFGKSNKYGSFPSVGLGYKIFDRASGLVNDLKVRANYGLTGNQEFDTNSAISKSRYNNGAISTVTNANPDLEWETVTSYGIGVDFSLLENKLTGSLDYFNRSTKNLIFPVPEAATKPGPASPRFVNLPGTSENNGFEVTLNYNIIDSDDLTWDVSANTSFLSNKVKDFSGFVQTGQIHGQGLSGAYAQILTNNKPLYTYYLFEFKEYDANGASQYTQPDGTSGALGTASKIQLGQALPKTNVGFSTTVRYKNFDLGTSFYGQYGHYIYNNTANAYFFRGAFPVRNIPKAVISSGQAAADPNSPSTKFLEKGDFLRWSNLTIGYTFDNSFLQDLGISNARLYANGNNLATVTDYTGLDPEVSVDKSIGGVPSAGMDYLAYPRARTYTLGLNITF